MKRIHGPTVILLVSWSVCAAITATFTVNTTTGKAYISPYIYGGNIFSTDYFSGANDAENFTFKREGGDALSAYNWENNFTNCGTDNGNANYDWLTSGFSSSKKMIPGISMTDFIDSCKGRGYAAMITVQMAGYVAADNGGVVTASPPNSRWKQLVINKGSAYADPPNPADNYVYVDEMINKLVTRYGSGGVKFYDLDNEPDIWSSTHPVMHPTPTTCTELITKSIQTAAMIKRLDPNAMVCGPALCCFYGYQGLSGASDWNTVKGSSPWFVSWYLQKMKQASDSVGVRLLDVLDLHMYSAEDISSYAVCVQHPRCLWDKKYVENDWVGQWNAQFLPYLTRISNDITANYPGTKFGTTELNNGDGSAIEHGIATADFLGIYAKYGVYLASFWATHSDFGGFNSSGYRIFRNYDGSKSTFGDTIVSATMSDTVNSSVYASLLGRDLHIILLNKNQTDPLTANFTLTTDQVYAAGDVWQFNGTGPTIVKQAAGAAIAGSAFSYTVPQASVSHFVFKATGNAIRQGLREMNGAAAPLFAYVNRTGALVYSIPRNEKANLLISDMTGRTLCSLQDVSGAGMFRPDVPEGLYTVCLTSSRGVLAYVKILKR
jgi:hypothetical protein